MTKKGKRNRGVSVSSLTSTLDIPVASPKHSKENLICPQTIKGTDDEGNFYTCHRDLTSTQAKHRDEFYRANELYWATGGYNGSNDDEAMIGDNGGIADGEDGLDFLDRYLASNKSNVVSGCKPRRFDHAVDLGAGVGRLTKSVLLKRYNEVRLVEGDEGWSKRSRVYLGRKRAARCSFTHQRLDNLTKREVQYWEPADLMWIQWTLQYLIDADVISCLRILSSGLREGSGILIVKENRPYGTQREDRFKMDTPGGEHERYDITRNDSHHRLLFQKAGLKVNFMERGEETNTYALTAL
mmetsp:Transcript_11883/g.16866  ORF Transcript_11883/g.16866 Transcript_11883/m.16866 type:complete len:298 (+) Transcript_11883:97-990(+)